MTTEDDAMRRVSALPARLFAYGTLMAGFSRRSLLGPSTLEGRGRVRGALYDFGEYPGVVLAGDGWVWGEVYRMADPDQRLPVIDRAEWYDPTDEPGSLYLRRRVEVELEPPPGHAGSTATCLAWIYVYNESSRGSPRGSPGGSPGHGPRVPSGDWRAHLAARGLVAR